MNPRKMVKLSNMHEFSNYSFTKEWINHTADTIKIIEKIDQNFDDVYLILQDVINGNNMYLRFYDRTVNMDEKTVINKIDYINSSILKEREYLDRVFKENYNEKYFVSKNGTYVLFVPLRENGLLLLYLCSVTGGVMVI